MIFLTGTATRRGRLLAAALTTAIGISLLGGCTVSKPADSAAASLATRYRQYPWAIVDPTPQMGAYSAAPPPHRTQYNITAQFDPKTVQVQAQQETRYTNDEQAPLPDLYFHLFANAPYFQTDEHGAHRSRPGYMHITRVTVDGQPVVIEGDGQLLHFQLPRPLAPGATAIIHLDWEETIPSTPDRLGQMGANYYLGNWYPTLAVHDQGGWHVDRYYKDSDPFFSYVADYDIRMTVPAEWSLGATGHQQEVLHTGATQTFRYTAENVRDFALVTGPSLKLYEDTVDGIQIHYLEDQSGGTSRLSGGDGLKPRDVLDITRVSIHHFNTHFGTYPYKDITVVSREGMEYPQFVMSEPNSIVLAHELAHQWWYGLLGNDENRQIWDEGLTEWSAQDVFRADFGTRRKQWPFRMPQRTERMDKTLYQYGLDSEQDPGIFARSIYGKGSVFWELLRQKMGDQKFYGMLQEMFKEHLYGVLTWEDWHQAVLKHGGPEMEKYWKEYVQGDNPPADLPLQPDPATAGKTN